LSDNSTLGVTAEHPIYSIDRQGFVLASDLREGERLLTKTGITKLVTKVIEQQAQPVYNLEIRQWHNFLVGSSGVVVHNQYPKFGKNFADKIFTPNDLDEVEKKIAGDSYSVLNSDEFEQILDAHKNKKSVLIKVEGYTVSYDDAPFSGLTNFKDNGFHMGREAFDNEEEVIQTVAHELHRLNTSKLKGQSGNGPQIKIETDAASSFAKKVLKFFK
jgi:hypothetical protein